MAKHIGLVAYNAEGATLCYRTIAQSAQEYIPSPAAEGAM